MSARVSCEAGSPVFSLIHSYGMPRKTSLKRPELNAQSTCSAHCGRTSPHERLLMSHLQCDIGQSRGACALTAHARYAIEGSSSPRYAPLCPPQPVVRPGPWNVMYFTSGWAAVIATRHSSSVWGGGMIHPRSGTPGNEPSTQPPSQPTGSLLHVSSHQSAVTVVPSVQHGSAHTSHGT